MNADPLLPSSTLAAGNWTAEWKASNVSPSLDPPQMREVSTFEQAGTPTVQARPCVLVVDDDTTSRKLLARALEHAGFDARQAANGREALTSVSENIPDVVLLDLQMPELNGAEACRKLREHENPAIRELPVIMLTAQDDEEAEVRCLESGANDFLAKPVGRATLTARIQTQLRLRALTLELRSRNEELERWRTNQLADLDAAKLTQSAIIPSRAPAISGWKLDSFFQPLIQVGGDVYGWRALGHDRCIVWMADATGHGAAAALVTTMVAHLFQQAIDATERPDEILRDVNREYFSVFRGKSFITAACALLTPMGLVSFSSAGHPPILVSRADATVENFMAGSTMIGLTPELAPRKTDVQLQPGEQLLIFTDGLYSLRSHSGERMTWESVSDVLRKVDRTSDLLPPLLREIHDLSTGQPFDDDTTVIVSKYLPENGTVA